MFHAYQLKKRRYIAQMYEVLCSIPLNLNTNCLSETLKMMKEIQFPEVKVGQLLLSVAASLVRALE
jgi:hypothetical protein